MRKIIKKSSVDWNALHVEIEVYEEGFNVLRQHLVDVFQPKHRKSIYNTIKLYLFLRIMNECKITHIAKEDLACMFFSKHTERLTVPLDYLVEANLLEVHGAWNEARHHFYYTYITKGLNVDVKDKMNTRIIEMEIPEHVLFYLKSPHLQLSASKTQLRCSPDEHKAKQTYVPSIANNPFVCEFTGWYEELLFAGAHPMPGHFSEADGRFYHYFHYCPSDYRQKSVTWDGENLVEYWDASSAFFIVLCYGLREFVEYTDDNLKNQYMDETRKMLGLALSGNLYSVVQKYHNDRTNYPVTRDTIKEWCQIYKGVSYKYLFKKDGSYKQTYYVKRLRYIDEYFEANFPNIRNYILSYPRIEVDNKNRKEWIVVNGSLVCKYSPKWISRIHKDFMPLEFKLFSIGICKRIFDKYGVKCLTVHDAIYMKRSDAERLRVNVNELLEIELGLRDEGPIPLW